MQREDVSKQAQQSSDTVPSTISELLTRLKQSFAQVALVPFQYLNRPGNRYRDGMGEVLVTGAVAQNASKALAHDLMRVPTMVQLIDNAAVAQTRLQVTARSTTSVTIVPLDAALDATALVRVC